MFFVITLSFCGYISLELFRFLYVCPYIKDIRLYAFLVKVNPEIRLGRMNFIYFCLPFECILVTK